MSKTKIKKANNDFKSTELTRVGWFSLVIFPPVGIPILWKDNRFKKDTKILLSVAFSMLFIALLLFLPGINLYKRISNEIILNSKTDPSKLVISEIVKAKTLVGKTEKDVVQMLGEPQKKLEGTFQFSGTNTVVKDSPKYSYNDGELEIKLVEGNVARVFIYPKMTILFQNYSKALSLLGLNKDTVPSFKNENAVKWSNIEGIYEVSTYKQDNKIVNILAILDEKYK